MVVGPSCLCMSEVRIQRDLKERIRSSQNSNEFAKKMKYQVSEGKAKDFASFDNGLLRFWDRVYVPPTVSLREEILEEAHKSKYTMHLGATKEKVLVAWYEGGCQCFYI